MNISKQIQKAFLPAFIILFILLTVNVTAQKKEKSELQKKIAELKGKIEKVTVKVDGKDVVFEGKDAEALVKKMKTNGAGKSFAYTIIKTDGDDDNIAIAGDDDEVIEAPNIELDDVFTTVVDKPLKDSDETIKIENKVGKSKVTITTTEDGKTTEKVLEGEDAEKYCEEHCSNVFYYSTPKVARVVVGKNKAGIIKVVPGKKLRIITEDGKGISRDLINVKVKKSDKNEKTIILKNKVKTDKDDNTDK